jgi:hypothetical protein
VGWLALAAALLASGAAPAESNGLETVRAALRQLAGTTPVTATLERTVAADRKDRPHEEGRVTLQITAGASSLSIRYPDELLDELRAERAEIDPEKPRPAQRVLLGFDVADVSSLLNHAQGLLGDLEGATVLAESEADWQGQKARLLELELVNRTSKADSKWMKSERLTMKLWITPEGLPLAADSDYVFRAGFLIFNFDGKEVRTRRYARAGDRLVVTQVNSMFDGEGFGEEHHERSETTVHLQPER